MVCLPKTAWPPTYSEISGEMLESMIDEILLSSGIQRVDNVPVAAANRFDDRLRELIRILILREIFGRRPKPPRPRPPQPPKPQPPRPPQQWQPGRPEDPRPQPPIKPGQPGHGGTRPPQQNRPAEPSRPRPSAPSRPESQIRPPQSNNTMQQTPEDKTPSFQRPAEQKPQPPHRQNISMPIYSSSRQKLPPKAPKNIT